MQLCVALTGWRDEAVPTNASPSVRNPFVERPDAQERRVSAISLAEAIRAASNVVPSHRREMLSIAVWKYTEAEGGKWATRYRSAAVVHGPVAPIQHEHVVTRATLVERMLVDGADVDAVLARAVGCLVTVEEHGRLTAVATSVEGWGRYATAEVEVLDMATGERLDLILP